jgi:hypothetical protein
MIILDPVYCVIIRGSRGLPLEALVCERGAIDFARHMLPDFEFIVTELDAALIKEFRASSK